MNKTGALEGEKNLFKSINKSNVNLFQTCNPRHIFQFKC